MGEYHAMGVQKTVFPVLIVADVLNMMIFVTDFVIVKIAGMNQIVLTVNWAIIPHLETQLITLCV